MAKKPTKQGSYGAQDITVLEGLEPVRKRPGMYIGGTGKQGLHHLIWEVVDNSIDEAMAGYATAVTIRFLPDDVISVTDDGRGIPVEKHSKTKKSALETVLTVLHAGGKFGGEGYKVSGGLHGVGVSVVNALSEWLEAEINRDGGVYKQRYERGFPQNQVRKQGTSKTTGTTITFKPDKEIFTETTFDWNYVLQHLRQQAYLTPGIRIHLIDERETGKVCNYTYLFEGGIKSYVRQLNMGKDVKNEKIFYAKQEFEEDRMVEVAMQYTDAYTDSVLTFANNIHTIEGGTHLTGFRTALTRIINDYARKSNFLKEKDDNLTADDVKEGLTAIISVKLREPQFEGQTKGKLGTPEMRTYVQKMMTDTFTMYLEENPREARAIIEKVSLAAKARMAARAARETVLRKGALDGFALPGKLADCSSKDPSQSEIFIVEGDSAGGCFSGDTKVRTVAGIEMSFEQLAADWEKGVTHFGYATDKSGDIRIVPLDHPRRTKKEAQLVEVEIDNGEKVQCTPDHRFRLRNGSYRRADQLAAGDSLMPLKIRFTQKGESPGEGYEMVWMNDKQEWNHTHYWADVYNLVTQQYARKSGEVRHHIDYNKTNNDPRNIVRMGKQEHLDHHAALASAQLKRLWKDPEYRKRKILQASKSAKQQWKDPKYREYMRQSATLQRQNPDMSKAVLDGFQTWFKNLTPDEYAAYCQRSADLFKEYWASQEHRQQQSKRVTEHFANNPEARLHNQQKANEQWADKDLRAWRSQKTIEQWQGGEYRENHSQAVRQWWEEHPEHAQKIRAARKRTWSNPLTQKKIRKGLATWRENTSSETKRELIRDGKKRKALMLVNRVLTSSNLQQAYDDLRRKMSPTSIRYDRLLNEHYQGDEAKLLEAAKNINCKVVAVRPLTVRRDVYDLTVHKYHNFALAAGVFVHNSAKSGRDRRFQAILPLRGKILNVERARLDKMLANNEVKALIIAMGTGIGEEFEIEKLRYHRIIIATDADVDGSHIRTLLLTLFFRYFQPIIEGGYMYIAQPPLYKIEKGKEAHYVYTEDEKDKLVKKLKTKEDTKINLQRYKGLGEMNPEELWDTTMDPEHRVLKQVSVGDAAEADRMFDVLMGNDVAPRKKWIQTHAKTVANLDI